MPLFVYASLPFDAKALPGLRATHGLIRTTQRFGELPALNTFDSRPCDVSFTHEAQPLERLAG